MKRRGAASRGGFWGGRKATGRERGRAVMAKEGRGVRAGMNASDREIARELRQRLAQGLKIE